MKSLQLGHVAAPKPCRLSQAHRVPSPGFRLASSSNSAPAENKAYKVVAAASHQQPARVDDSLQVSSSNGTAHSSNGAGAPVLSHASSVLQWSAASLADCEVSSSSSSSSSHQQHARGSSSSHQQHARGSSSSSSVQSGVLLGSWDALQHVPSHLADALDAPAAQSAADVELPISNGRQPVEHDSSSSGSAGKNRLSDAGYQLMLVITQQTTCWQDLAQLVQSQSHCFTAQHCAAALHQLSSLWQQQQQQDALQQQELRTELRLQLPAVLQLAAVLLRGLRQQIGEARGRDVADAMCAAAKLGVPLHVSNAADAAAASAAAGSCASSSDSNVRRPGSAAAGQLSGVADALLQRSAVLMREGRLKALPLSRLLWGVTQLGLQESSDWWAATLEATAMQLQQTQLQQQQPDPQQQQLEHSYNGQSLSLVGWAVAKLQAPAPDAWWSCYAAAAASLLPQMQPQHLSRCVWALATARQAPDAGWLTALYAASAACMHQFDPQGLAVMLWALAVLQLQPPQQWLQQYAAASAACMYGYSMQHLSMTVWAFGSFARSSTGNAAAQGSSSSGRSSADQQQQQPSAAWLEQAYSQLSLLESEVTAQGLACVLWGLVRLRAAVPAARLQQLEMLAGPALRDAEPQGLAVIVWALGQLRGSATRRVVVQRVRRHCQQHPQLLSKELSGQGLFMLLHGLARFNAWQPEGFKQQLLAAATLRLQQGLPPAQVLGGTAVHTSSSSSIQAFKAQQVPVVLLSLTQLQITMPTPLLQQCEQLLLPQLQELPLQQLTVCVFAMGRAHHNPGAAFLDAAMARVDADQQQIGPQDAAQLLCGLAAMGGVREQLILQPQQPQRMARLLERLQQVVPLMDHSCLAMSMWAIARLSLRPSELLLQAFLQATSAQLPNMSLISITTLLSGLRALEYLPPLSWMVESCNAARSIYNSDVSCKSWQRRNNLRRLEETVTWFNMTVQQQAVASGAAGAAADGQNEQAEAGISSVGGKGSRSAGVLGVTAASSEAMIAAAVGVAAAVAQQWRW